LFVFFIQLYSSLDALLVSEDLLDVHLGSLFGVVAHSNDHRLLGFFQFNTLRLEFGSSLGQFSLIFVVFLDLFLKDLCYALIC
jgi:hypothetical protein